MSCCFLLYREPNPPAAGIMNPPGKRDEKEYNLNSARFLTNSQRHKNNEDQQQHDMNHVGKRLYYRL